LATFGVYAFYDKPTSIAAATATATPYFVSNGTSGSWSQQVSNSTPSTAWLAVYDENTGRIYVSTTAQSINGATLNIATMTELL